MSAFEDLNLTAAVLRAVREMGFEEPTPVQTQAIPSLLAGHDIVVQALTGTGKTAAYGIPLAERLDPHINRPQAIILAPTRELAVQVSEHITQLCRYRNLRFLPIYGGQAIERQLMALRRGVHGIVATPGRLMDHMRRGTIDLSGVNMLVLDEADQMLQMGFQEDVEYIAGHLADDRVTALFSATMPQPILAIVHKYMRNPEMVILSKPRELTVPAVEQVYYQVPFPRKFDALCSVMDARAADRTLVFCSTKRMVDEVAERLPAHGYTAEAIHGDISQGGRERVLRSFREGKTDVLVATDVAARGLDISDVGLVVNFDIPADPENYVHRIGRTARSGHAGAAITFINPRELRELQVIQRVTGAHIEAGRLPTAADAEERGARVLEERLLEAMEKGEGRRFRAVVGTLAVEHDLLDIAAAAVSLAAEHRFRARKPNSEAPAASESRPAPEYQPDCDSRPHRAEAPTRYPGDYPKRRVTAPSVGGGGAPSYKAKGFKPRTFGGPGGKSKVKSASWHARRP